MAARERLVRPANTREGIRPVVGVHGQPVRSPEAESRVRPVAAGVYAPPEPPAPEPVKKRGRPKKAAAAKPDVVGNDE